jgi:hypothetical protein
MKSYIKVLIAAALLLISTSGLQAQAPPHPNNGVAPSAGPGGNTPVGAGAPIADGQFILLALGLAYAGRKWYEHKKQVESPV